MSPPFRLRRALGAVLAAALFSGLLPLGACASSKAPPAGAPTTPSSSLEPGDSSPLAKQRVTSSLSVEGIRFLFTSLVSNFSSFSVVAVILVAMLGVAYWQGRVGNDLWWGALEIGPFLLHPIVLTYVVSGSFMISTFRVPKP